MTAHKTAKPKPKWQELQKLAKSEVAAHLIALREIKAKADKQGHELTMADFRSHLEPLLKHYHLSHRTDTLAVEINGATGLTYNKFTYAKVAKEWGIPPANAQGRGLAKTTSMKSQRIGF